MSRPKRIADDEVLRLAREVILARGVGVSTVEIAAHVGLSQPTLFQRFGDKPTLLRRALAPDPIVPKSVIGPPDEPDTLGVSEHIAALTGRLYHAMLMVVERMQVAGGLFAHGAQDRAHAEGGVDVLVAALFAHLGQLRGLRMPGALAAETLLFLVHGAAAMALAGAVSERGALLVRLKTAASASLVTK